jgi:hypothetical protein
LSYLVLGVVLLFCCCCCVLLCGLLCCECCWLNHEAKGVSSITKGFDEATQIYLFRYA